MFITKKKTESYKTYQCEVGMSVLKSVIIVIINLNFKYSY